MKLRNFSFICVLCVGDFFLSPLQIAFPCTHDERRRVEWNEFKMLRLNTRAIAHCRAQAGPHTRVRFHVSNWFYWFRKEKSMQSGGLHSAATSADLHRAHHTEKINPNIMMWTGRDFSKTWTLQASLFIFFSLQFISRSRSLREKKHYLITQFAACSTTRQQQQAQARQNLEKLFLVFGSWKKTSLFFRNLTEPRNTVSRARAPHSFFFHSRFGYAWNLC